MQWVANIFGPAKQARMLMVRPNGEELAYFGRLADEGKLKPIVSARLRLDQATEAHRTNQAGHVRGKVVLEA